MGLLEVLIALWESSVITSILFELAVEILDRCRRAIQSSPDLHEYALLLFPDNVIYF